MRIGLKSVKKDGFKRRVSKCGFAVNSDSYMFMSVFRSTTTQTPLRAFADVLNR